MNASCTELRVILFLFISAVTLYLWVALLMRVQLRTTRAIESRHQHQCQFSVSLTLRHFVGTLPLHLQLLQTMSCHWGASVPALLLPSLPTLLANSAANSAISPKFPAVIAPPRAPFLISARTRFIRRHIADITISGGSIVANNPTTAAHRQTQNSHACGECSTCQTPSESGGVWSQSTTRWHRHTHKVCSNSHRGWCCFTGDYVHSC